MNRPALQTFVTLLWLALLAGRAAAAPPAREREAEAEMLKAKQAMQAGLYEVAVGHLLVARSLVPDASGPYLNLGIAYQQLGRCQDALPMIEEYLRRKPKSPQASAAATLARCRSATPPRARVDAEPAGTPPTTSAPPPAPPTAAAPVQAVPSASPASPTMASGINDAGTSRTMAAQPPAALAGGDGSAGVPLAWLTIHVDPVAADITLDGRRLAGRVRAFERALPGGVYNLSVGARGYRTLTRQLRLDPGQQLNDTVTLHRQAWPIVVGVLAGLCGSAAIALTLYYELRPLRTHMPATQTSGFRFPSGSF
jgi:tetratricopeptide (TPR) repeat protein